MARKPSPKPKHVAHTKRGQKLERPKLPASHTPLAEMDRMRAAFESAIAPYVPETPPAKARKSYDPAICEIVIAKALLGHTIGATCAFIGCSRSAFNDWAASYPELTEAVARAKNIRQAFGEGHLIDMMRRGGDSTRMSAVKLQLINVGGEDWKERLTSEHNVTFNLGSLIAESMKIAGPVIEGDLIEQPKRDPTEPQD